MAGEVEILGADPFPLLFAGILILDILFGDPGGKFHLICLIGRSLNVYEKVLRRRDWSGYAGGIALFFLLGLTWLVPVLLLDHLLGCGSLWLGINIIIGFFLFAFRSLLEQGWVIERACRQNDLVSARQEAAKLVNRDTQTLNIAGCRRVMIESLSENLVDGVIAPLFYLFMFGIPGMMLYKLVNTMDSMVGFKTEHYRRFGWFGARFDDVLTYLPARLTFALIVMVAALLPGYSASKALCIGLKQHHLFLGPNPGWSEAPIAGALGIRLIGPIRLDGTLVTDIWVGDPADPCEPTAKAYGRLCVLMIALTVVFCTLFLWIHTMLPVPVI